MRSFKELEVYQKAFGTALNVHEKSLDFPKIEQFALADQMRRASKSICANIAEGHGKLPGSKAEFKRFLTIAIGSANEMLVWVGFSHKLGYVDAEQADNWNDVYDHIAKMLNKLKSSQ